MKKWAPITLWIIFGIILWTLGPITAFAALASLVVIYEIIRPKHVDYGPDVDLGRKSYQ